MNWMCSALDSYRLVSNSDAHSPPMLGREATTFNTDLDYFAMADALRTGNGLAGTLEFYPEEGKYHLDGHRKCGVRLEPEETRDHGGQCPKCDKPLTVGVLHRVSRLADRPAGYRPAGAPASTNLLRLPEILGEIMSVGPRSKKVTAEVDRLVAALGPELDILTGAPHDEITRVGGGLLAEAVARLRRGEVIREAGFDGEYGTIRLMRPGELQATATLFDMARPDPPRPENRISERLAPGRSATVRPAGRDRDPAASRPDSGVEAGRADGIPPTGGRDGLPATGRRDEAQAADSGGSSAAAAGGTRLPRPAVAPRGSRRRCSRAWTRNSAPRRPRPGRC